MREGIHLIATESGNTALVLMKLHNKPLKTVEIKILFLKLCNNTFRSQ